MNGAGGSRGDIDGKPERVSERRERINRAYLRLLATVCGAGLLPSSRALTFWICEACSLRVASLLESVKV